MRRLAIPAVLLATLPGCGLPYKALNGKIPTYIGYTVEHLAADTYRVEYHAGAGANYGELQKLLERYAADLCLSDYTLGSVERNEFVPTVWADVKPDATRNVSATMVCGHVDKAMVSQSSITSF